MGEVRGEGIRVTALDRLAFQAAMLRAMRLRKSPQYAQEAHKLAQTPNGRELLTLSEDETAIAQRLIISPTVEANPKVVVIG